MSKNYLKALGFSILMLVFPIGASIGIEVASITEPKSAYLVQAVAFALAALVGLIVMKRMHIAVHTNMRASWKAVLGFVPLIGVEVLGLLLGIQPKMSVAYVLSLFVFTLAVGIGEEVFFRGIVLNILKRETQRTAILGSSLLFGFLHLANLAGGVSGEYAILQVIFAFLFGFIAANIVVITKSLVPVIVWHVAHDFIALLSGDVLNSVSLLVLCAQLLIMALYAVYLWKQTARRHLETI